MRRQLCISSRIREQVDDALLRKPTCTRLSSGTVQKEIQSSIDVMSAACFWSPVVLFVILL